MKKHYSIKITGRVQNVGFRHHAVQEATKYGITGIVKNMPNGVVYIEAEGEEEVVKEFLNWCQNGPSWARVDDVQIEEGDLKHYDDFSVQYGHVL